MSYLKKMLLLIAMSYFFSCGPLMWEEGDEVYHEPEYANEVWLINVESGQEYKVADGFSPKFTPDNQYILFLESTGERSAKIMKVDLTGEHITQQTPSMLYLNDYEVCYETSELLFAAQNYKNRDYDVYKFDLSSKTLKNMTQTIKHSELVPHFICSGEKIIYGRWAGIAILDSDGTETIVEQVDGGTISNVLLTPSCSKLVMIIHPGTYLRVADWTDTSQDTLLTFGASEYKMSPTKDEVYYNSGGANLLNLDTFERTKLSVPAAWNVTFSPDGEFLAFADASGKLFLYNLNTHQKKLVMTPGKQRAFRTASLAISPNNEWVAYDRRVEIPFQD